MASGIVPELFERRSLLAAIRRRTSFLLKLRLLGETGLAVTDVPVVIGTLPPSFTRSHASCRVLVSGVHAASLRAANYARSLGFEDTRAVFFASDRYEAHDVRQQWRHEDASIPLEAVEAPFRDLGQPLLASVREITADPGAVAVVVMPELVVSGATRLLHNQRALYVKRLLLFEPRVILTSVPYHLR
jgi:hypothetical protein